MKWLSVHVGGQKWRVDLIKGNSHHFDADEDEQVYGITYHSKCRIYISKDQDEQAREDTLLHELLHAAFGVSSASQTIARLCEVRSEPADAHKEEERIVESLTPVLHRLIKDLGFRFPRLEKKDA